MENEDRLSEVNAHVLQAILRAGDQRSIVASRDIFDQHGRKLLAQDKQITSDLQARLQGRKLRVPLEASLRFESGLDRTQLRASFGALVDSGHVLAAVVRPWATAIQAQVNSLPLDPVLLFLLNTMRVTQTQMFEHAVQAMALAGAMSVRAGDAPGELRVAMMAGLVHDVGELYLAPGLDGAARGLDLGRYRTMAAHARLGELLLAGLGQYPVTLSRAVGEHHERLDGSGYPALRIGDGISALGRMLAVVETTLGVLSAPDAPLARASFALRVVPGEYDGQWVGLVSDSASGRRTVPDALHVADIDRAWAGLEQASRRIEGARALAVQLALSHRSVVREVAVHASHLLQRLRAGWNKIGLWAGALESRHASDEVLMAESELRYRLSVMERDCLWQREDLEPDDMGQLEPLWRCLDESGPR